MKYFLMLNLAFFLGFVELYAQCTPAPPADITCSSGTQVDNSSSNLNINGGDSFRSCQGSTSVSNVNLSGGDLNVCGELTISNLTFNSGRIIIARQGTLTINNNVTMNSNCIIANYGTLIINGNLEFQNNNNYFYNYASDAKTTISGQMIFAQNTGQLGVFINKGYVTANAMQVRDGGKLCLEAGSILSIVNYTNGNNETNQVSFGSASGTANLCYSGNFTMNNSKSLTTSSNVRICKATGATTSGSGNFGSATVVNNCVCGSAPAAQTGAMTCFTNLPVNLVSFQTYITANKIKIEWITIDEVGVQYYELQKSTDGQIFYPIRQIQVGQNSTQRKTYTYFDEIVSENLLYYRLKLVNQDQSSEYLGIRSVYLDQKMELDEEDVLISANPTREAFSIEFLKPYKNQVFIEIHNLSGIKVYQQDIKATEKNVISTQKFANGIYFLKIYTNRKIIIKKIIIN